LYQLAEPSFEEQETDSNDSFIACKYKIDSTISIASMISNIERVHMGGHSVLLLLLPPTFVINSKTWGKSVCHSLETRLKNQYHAFPLSEITHKSLWGAIKCFCGNVQIFFLFVRVEGRERVVTWLCLYRR
jgi:hypothetical protein